MSAARALSRRLETFAKKTSTPVRLHDLFKVGRGDLSERLSFARFLRKEVAVRNAQLCYELRLLPFGLAETKGVDAVVSDLSSYVDILAQQKEDYPCSPEELETFTELIGKILEDNTGVVSMLGTGVLQVRESQGAQGYEDIRAEIDLILDRFFMKRIGLRFLLQHHLEMAKPPQDGVSGIIHSNVKMGRILRECAAEARRFCDDRYGCAPDVEVLGDGRAEARGSWGLRNLNLSYDRQFTYVPIHLLFSCSVLLQNACYAVAERHQASASKSIPPVRVIFAYGEDEVTVKVSDEGGGVPQDDIHYVWSYFSAPGGTVNEPGRGHRHSTPLGPYTTLKAGLPLARLHARYYGGDLILKPIQGFGTDAYLILNRLGNDCENLPRGVRVSPAMRDSSVGDEASVVLESVGDLSELELAFLKKRLKEFRIAREADTALLNSMQAP
jgi:pyruvate dehydrogenase kinase 2/3/4